MLIIIVMATQPRRGYFLNTESLIVRGNKIKFQISMLSILKVIDKTLKLKCVTLR